MRPVRLLSALLCFTLAPSTARAESAAPERETMLEAPPRPAEMPLSLLPDPPSTQLPPPRELALEAIDRLLSEILSTDPMKRERAHRQLLEAKPDWVSGLARRIDQLAERGGRREMGEVVESVKRRRSSEAEDFLARVLDASNLETPSTRSLIQILAINRMLASIGTWEAVRELVRVYARFGEFIRVDVQNQLDRLEDRALAGLIEATQHDAESVRKWAKRQLDLRGKAIAHELVRTDDPDALADILVALGRTKNQDAPAILLSYAAAPRLQLQRAARQGIALLGDSAAWSLRDAYLQTTGKRPPREWTWKRLARELFTEFDRLRLEKLYSLYQTAKTAAERGDLEVMKQNLDEVLLENPLFEERDKMASLYLRVGKAWLETKPLEARDAFRRAARIGLGQEQKEAESFVFALEAKELAARGLYDRGLIDMATALHPDNELARTLKRDGAPSVAALSPLTRYGLAGAAVLIAGLGVAMSLGITWHLRKRAQAMRPGPETSDPVPQTEEGLPGSEALAQASSEGPSPASSDGASQASSEQISQATPPATEEIEATLQSDETELTLNLGRSSEPPASR